MTAKGDHGARNPEGNEDTALLDLWERNACGDAQLSEDRLAISPIRVQFKKVIQLCSDVDKFWLCDLCPKASSSNETQWRAATFLFLKAYRKAMKINWKHAFELSQQPQELTPQFVIWVGVKCPNEKDPDGIQRLHRFLDGLAKGRIEVVALGSSECKTFEIRMKETVQENN